MKSPLQWLRSGRLAPTFTILVALSAGILIGSVAVHGVQGKEGPVNSSDATPLTVPNPVNLSTTFTKIAKEVAPAVVNINTESIPKDQKGQGQGQQRWRYEGPGGGGSGSGEPPQNFQDFFNRFFGGQIPGPEDQVRESLGSGFIVDSRGYIITNNHVVAKADRIYVKLPTDPKGFHGHPAKVVGVDKDTDLAVVKIDVGHPLPTVKLGNSDGAQVGDWVIAIGSPLGLTQTVTAGIVSAKNRTIQPGAAGQFQHFIQTDAAINPGNSGGPLVDMAGQVIGVNTAIYTQSAGNEGIGFAMPSDTVIKVYNDLIGPEHQVIRGSIGVQFQENLPPAVGRVYGFKNGVLVNAVTPNGPAAKAGLKAGDIIISSDGTAIKDGDQLVTDIANRKPGSKVTLGYLRDGKKQEATLTIANRAQLYGNLTSNNNGPSGPQSAPNPSEGKLGITVSAVPPELAAKGVKGAFIQHVKPGSFGDEVGLARGLIITQVNRQQVDSPDQLQTVVSGLKSGEDVVFRVLDSRDPTAGGTYLGGTLQ